MIEHSEIRAILPQGHPMVLVDRVVSLEPGASIVGIKAISGSEPCYCEVTPGSEADRFAYPTSLLVESFGQTAAVLWLKSLKSFNRDPKHLLMFVAARNVKIEGCAFPGDVLRHIARLDHVMEDNVFVSGETWVGDRRIASIGSMIAVVRPRSVVFGTFALSNPEVPMHNTDIASPTNSIFAPSIESPSTLNRKGD